MKNLKYLKTFESYSSKFSETIGEITADGKLIFGHGKDGYIYKNYEVYYNNIDAICYVAEDDELENGYKPIDFYNLAKKAVEENKWKIDIQKLANDIFDLSSWQHPETIVDEMVRGGDFDGE